MTKANNYHSSPASIKNNNSIMMMVGLLILFLAAAPTSAVATSNSNAINIEKDESKPEQRGLLGAGGAVFDPNTVLMKVEDDDPVPSCRRRLPEWVLSVTPDRFQKEFDIGAEHLSDKTIAHKYQHMYHRYLAPMAARTCEQGYTNKIRILEIGLGCGKRGGMRMGTPGGSALAWRHMFPFPQFDLDLHIMEFDAECANKWQATHEHIAHVHTGDASSIADLDRVMMESGGQPFDLIIDDASHLNEHQIATFEHMIQYVARGGFYTIEDIHSSCKRWPANTGKVETGLRVTGTPGCMETLEGNPTIFSKLVDWQKALVIKESPFKDVSHIDICFEAAVIGKVF